MSDVDVGTPTIPPGIVGVIYGFRLETSSEFRYVGLTRASIGRRTRQHFKKAADGVKTPFYDWLRKTPESAVFVQSLQVVTTTLTDLGAAEISWIARLRERGDRLLNLSDGGLGPTGVVWTDEQREAARVRSTGRPGLSRSGQENPFFGREHSLEQRAKWVESRKGTNSGASNPNFGKFGPDHPSYGHVMSPESRERLSEQKRGEFNPNFGKTTSPETRAKLSAALKGRAMPSSVRSAHTRHHTNKGVHNPNCRFCVDDASTTINSSESEAQQ
jgi:hypothetical protein